MSVVLGILFPATVLQSGWFQTLAAFVAVNTLVYAAVSVVTILPPWHRVSRRLRGLFGRTQ